MGKTAAALVVAVALSAATPAFAACMSPEREEGAQGLLVSGRFKDAADRPESAFILRLAEPACLEGNDAMDKVDNTRTIHVYSTNDAVSRRIAPLDGKSVRVRGKPFGAHTAHHHAPIVMDLSEIEAR